ncbi:hypothetical protein HOC37_03405 [bacterium]|nr:hypothetical protein [bacterium]MBT3581616.1 hypothetical protein [bacterium]MBT4552015.1 hypothetical protein [bacterium]
MELILAVAMLAIILAIAIPRFDVPLTTKLRLENETRRIQADLFLTRRLAITHRDTYILKVYPVKNEYAIFKNRVVPQNQIGETRIIKTQISASGDNNFIFELLGNLAANSGTNLNLSSGVYQYEISVIIPTGKVNITEL